MSISFPIAYEQGRDLSSGAISPSRASRVRSCPSSPTPASGIRPACCAVPRRRPEVERHGKGRRLLEDERHVLEVEDSRARLDFAPRLREVQMVRLRGPHQPDRLGPVRRPVVVDAFGFGSTPTRIRGRATCAPGSGVGIGREKSGSRASGRSAVAPGG